MREQVALGEDVDDPAFAQHRHMAQAVARHQHRRVRQPVLHVERVHRLAHDFADRPAQGPLRQRHAAEDVVARQDAEHLALIAQHQHRAHAPLVHRAQGLGQRRAGRAGQRRLGREVGKPGFERLLRQRLRRKRSLRGAPRELEKAQHAAVQEVGERRALQHQRLHRRRGQPQAEAVFVGGVGGSDGATGQQGPHREQIAGDVLDRTRGVGHAAPAADTAAAHIQQGLHRPAGRIEHHLVRREVQLRRGGEELVDVLRLHRRERHVLRQFGAQMTQQRSRRARTRRAGWGFAHEPDARPPGTASCLTCIKPARAAGQATKKAAPLRARPWVPCAASAVRPRRRVQWLTSNQPGSGSARARPAPGSSRSEPW